MATRSRRPALEQLEPRLSPAVAGTPWLDPQHLTLSFAPDGTPAGSGAVSNLEQTFADQMPTGGWRLEVMRAFQSWAVNANLNVGVVSDGGQALGGAGLMQGDSRFGDFRIAGQALGGPDVLATGNPFRLDGNTWSGDLLFNTALRFGVGSSAAFYDLFSVAMHEAGHAFGLGDNPDVRSALFANYAGVRAGPSAQDVLDLQARYGGARRPDSFDARQGNDSLQSASSLGSFSAPITGDVTTLGDADFYRFTIPSNFAAGSTVYVQVRTSGISLLVPSLTLYDSSGTVIGSAAANSPLGGDLSVRLANGNPGAVYFVRVGNATQSDFGVGSYQLGLSSQAGVVTRPAVSFANPDNGRNDALQSATVLTGRNSGGTTLNFAYQASINALGDVDFYRVRSQATANDVTQEMIVLVSALEVNGLAPVAQVYDGSGNLVPSQVISNSQGYFAIQVSNTLSATDYFVRVASLAPSGSRATGNYLVGINFNATATVALQSLAGGTLTPASAQQTQSLTMQKAGALQLVLSADAADGGAATQVQMRIYDRYGNLVFTLTAFAGQTASTGVTYLAAGTYTVLYVAVSQGGALSGDVSFSVKGTVMSDPLGPALVSTEPTSPMPPPTTTTTTTTDQAYYTWNAPSFLALAMSFSWVDPYYY